MLLLLQVCTLGTRGDSDRCYRYLGARNAQEVTLTVVTHTTVHIRYLGGDSECCYCCR